MGFRLWRGRWVGDGGPGDFSISLVLGTEGPAALCTRQFSDDALVQMGGGGKGFAYKKKGGAHKMWLVYIVAKRTATRWWEGPGSVTLEDDVETLTKSLKGPVL